MRTREYILVKPMKTESNERKSKVSVKRYWFALTAIIGLLIAAVLYIENTDTLRVQQEQRLTVLNKLSTVRARLEGVINGNLLVITGLITEISLNPEITQDEFSRYARLIMAQSTQIRNIGAARDMVITHMYPMEGNEKALGLDYRENKEQRAAAQKAREVDGIFVAGPVNLVQGGRGFVARTPIYEVAASGEHDRGRFWGLVSTVIDEDRLYKASGLSDPDLPIEIAIRGQDSSGSEGGVFFGRPDLFEEAGVLLDVSLVHGSWQLGGAPKGGWTQATPNATIIRSVAFVVLLLVIAALFFRARRRQEKALVEIAVRESESRYRRLTEISPVGIFETDAKGDYTFVNEKWREIAGLRREQAAGRGWIMALHPDDRVRVDTEWYTATKESTMFRSEFRFMRPDGGVSWLIGLGLNMVDAAGKTIKYVGTITDITQRKYLEEQVRRSQKMEAIGQLTGGIAHDLNNVLAIISMNTGLLNELIENDPEAHRHGEATMRGIKRASDLTRKLLDFSRTEARETKRVSANEFIRGMEGLIAKSVTPKISLHTDLAEDVWFVEIDPGDLEDSIVNLALNAGDAMPNGGTLVVETANKVIDQDYANRNPGITVGEYVMISVSDTGTGMTPETVEKAFEPFFTTKDVGKGTGLGLSMVYGFVQRSGGQVRIDSEPGEGTSVRLYLPRVLGVADDDVARYSAQAKLPWGDETILVVDDEEELVDAAVISLRALGYRTVTALDGNAALEILRQDTSIDLLFSDVIMPGGVDGYHLAIEALHGRPDLKVLLTSGFTRRREAFGNGNEKIAADLARSMLQKPYNSAELAISVRRALDRAG